MRRADSSRGEMQPLGDLAVAQSLSDEHGDPRTRGVIAKSSSSARRSASPESTAASLAVATEGERSEPCGEEAGERLCECTRVSVGRRVESPTTARGVKGVGESGPIGPPAAIANAIVDALGEYGVDIDTVPVSPTVVRELIRNGDHQS